MICDADEKTDLIVGDQNGRIGIISDYRHADLQDGALEHNVVFNLLLESYSDKNLGGQI